MLMLSCGKNSKKYEKQGDEFYSKEQFSKSIEFYKKALEYDNKNKDAFHSLGRSYDNLDDFKSAIIYYSKALEIDTMFALAYRSRGYARYKLQDYNNALDDYLKSIKIDPNNATAYRNTGAIYKKLCNYEKAREYYYISLKYKPDHYGAIDDLATIEFDLGNYETSISLCYKVIGHLDTGQDSPFGTLGLAYLALEKWDSVIVNLTKALEYGPWSHHYNNRGKAFVGKKEYVEALMDYNHAIKLDSLNPTFFLNRADLYYSTRKYIKALQDYDRSIELSAKYLGYNCGICYNNRAWTKKAIGDIKGYELDEQKAKKLGYPEKYKPFCNLESCFYYKDK